MSDASTFEIAWGSAIALFSDAQLVRFGSFIGTTAYAGQTVVSRGGADVALVELDANGKSVSADPMGTALDDRVLSVAVDASDHIFASYFETQNTTGDESDLRVVKLSR